MTMTVPAYEFPVEGTDLVFKNLTDLSFVQHTHSLNSAVWSGKLTLDQYLEREQVLAKTKACANGLLTYWVLVRKDSEITESGILSACELLLRRGVRSYKCLETNEVKYEICPTYVLGAVYTAPEQRGKGFAKILIRQLNTAISQMGDEIFQNNFKIDPQQYSSVPFVVLYSEIGEFYSQFGYTSRHITTTHIKVASNVEKAELRVEKLSESIDMLRRGQFEELCAKDAARVVQTVKEQAIASNGDKFFVAVLPDWQLFDWHHARADFVYQFFHAPVPEFFGAKTKCGSYIIWNYDYASDCIYILRTHFTGDCAEEEFYALISLVIKYAAASGLKEVAFYDEDVKMDKQLLKGVFEDVELGCPASSLPAIQNFDHSKPVEWLECGRYAWF